MSAFVVKRTVELDATPAEVWDALTNPEKTKKYFFHCGAYSDWKEGSSITFKGKLFLIKNIEMVGTILKVIPGKILKYTLHNGDGSSKSTVTDELYYRDGQTILSISDDVGSGDGAEKRFKRSEKGWDKVLDGLKELLKK